MRKNKLGLAPKQMLEVYEKAKEILIDSAKYGYAVHTVLCNCILLALKDLYPDFASCWHSKKGYRHYHTSLIPEFHKLKPEFAKESKFIMPWFGEWNKEGYYKRLSVINKLIKDTETKIKK